MSAKRERVDDDETADRGALNSKEVSLEARIRDELLRSGERDRLKRLLRERLTECGWRDAVKQRCREFLRERGREGATADDIVAHVRPAGRAAVPDSVKADLLAAIRAFMADL